MSLDTPPATPAEGHASGAAICVKIGLDLSHGQLSFGTLRAWSSLFGDNSFRAKEIIVAIHELLQRIDRSLHQVEPRGLEPLTSDLQRDS